MQQHALLRFLRSSFGFGAALFEYPALLLILPFILYLLYTWHFGVFIPTPMTWEMMADYPFAIITSIFIWRYVDLDPRRTRALARAKRRAERSKTAPSTAPTTTAPPAVAYTSRRLAAMAKAPPPGAPSRAPVLFAPSRLREVYKAPDYTLVKWDPRVPPWVDVTRKERVPARKRVLLVPGLPQVQKGSVPVRKRVTFAPGSPQVQHVSNWIEPVIDSSVQFDRDGDVIMTDDGTLERDSREHREVLTSMLREGVVRIDSK